MRDKAFTRERKLTFSKMIVLMTQKSVKSLQNILNEAEVYLSNLLNTKLVTVTKGAYTQAREKLNYTAFIELCHDIRDQFYDQYEYATYKDFRLLGIDGSLITLPDEEGTREAFGTVNVINQHKDKNKQIVQARVSLLYDLLNGVVIDAMITDRKTHEITIAKDEHFAAFKRGDLVIFDRSYPSYEIFAAITHKHKADYLIRVKKSTYKKYTEPLFDKNSKDKDITVTITPPTKTLREEMIAQNLPLELKVRFVQVILPDGEVEVLATSILDHEVLKLTDFRELYFKRWKIETFYDIVKNRLSLENFTGTTPLAIRQDFYATMFISNIEALVSYDINEEFKEEKNSKKIDRRKKYEQKVNKSVSFNTIKNHCFDLFFSDKDIDEILEKIYQLLKTNKVAIRPDRQFKRPDAEEGKITKGIKSANYQRRQKKIVY